MKDLLSKKAYCYKIYILQINSGAYPPPPTFTPCMDYFLLFVKRNSWFSLFFDFSKVSFLSNFPYK